MKKVKIIFYILLILSIFMVGCSCNVSNDVAEQEEDIITLKVNSFSDEEIIATEGNSNVEEYQISNCQVNITDEEGNILSWSDLKDAKIIEIHYLGGIKEISPMIFNKITTIVIKS